MTVPTPRPPADGDGAERSGTRSGGLAKWQKVVGMIGLAVLVVLVIVLATGDHGPGRHASGDSPEQPVSVEDASGHTPSSWNR